MLTQKEIAGGLYETTLISQNPNAHNTTLFFLQNAQKSIFFCITANFITQLKELFEITNTNKQKANALFMLP